LPGWSYGGEQWLGAAALVLWHVGAVAQLAASMLYIRWLAPRIPSPAIAARAALYVWLLPLIYAVLLPIQIGPAAAAIMSLLVLNDLSQAIKAVRVARSPDGTVPAWM